MEHPGRIWLPPIVTHRLRTATSTSVAPGTSTPMLSFDSRTPRNGRHIPYHPYRYGTNGAGYHGLGKCPVPLSPS